MTFFLVYSLSFFSFSAFSWYRFCYSMYRFLGDADTFRNSYSLSRHVAILDSYPSNPYLCLSLLKLVYDWSLLFCIFFKLPWLCYGNTWAGFTTTTDWLLFIWLANASMSQTSGLNFHFEVINNLAFSPFSKIFTSSLPFEDGVPQCFYFGFRDSSTNPCGYCNCFWKLYLPSFIFLTVKCL